MKRILILLAITMLAVSLPAQTLKAYAMESEPLGFIEGGTAKGEHVDYLKAIAERAGVDIQIEVVPKSKLFAALKNGDVDLAIFFRSPKWDNYVEYCAKIRDIKVIALNRADSPLTSYDDLHNSSRVGVLANTSINSQFDSDTQITKYSVSNYETMIKLLKAKRIDTAVGNAIVLSYLINKLGFSDSIQSNGVSLGDSAQWLQFCNKSSHLDLIPKFQKAVKELQAEGELDKILTSYAGNGWRQLNQ